MICLDESVLIALVSGDAGADAFADRLELERVRLVSALSVSKAVDLLCRRFTFSVPAAREAVRRIMAAGNFQLVQIGEREVDLAVDAYSQYGADRHPAKLTMDDCYAYAGAKANRAKLLTANQALAKTDITLA